jgi:phosphate uptake regulator
MQRNIIKQGNNSYTLTLPIKWIRENNLDKTLKISILEENESLILQSEEKKIEKKIKISLENKSKRLIRVILNNLYRAGYTEITLINLKKDVEFIENLVTSRLLGFEVINISEKEVKIKNIAEPNFENFDSILRKIFFIIKQSFQNFDNKESISDKVNLYINYLQRVIINSDKFIRETAHNYYLITTRLLLIQHSLSRINKKPILLNETLELFEEYTKNFFQENMENLIITHNKLSKLIHETYIKELEKSKSNFIDNYYIGDIIRNLHLISTNSISIFSFREI